MNAATASIFEYAKKVDVTENPLPGSSKGGYFVLFPFEQIFTILPDMEKMSSLHQLEYIIDLIDTVALFGVFGFFVLILFLVLRSQKISNFIISVFPF